MWNSMPSPWVWASGCTFGFAQHMVLGLDDYRAPQVIKPCGEKMVHLFRSVCRSPGVSGDMRTHQASARWIILPSRKLYGLPGVDCCCSFRADVCYGSFTGCLVSTVAARFAQTYATVEAAVERRAPTRFCGSSPWP